MKPSAAPLRKPLFWLLVLIFLGIVFLHYTDFFFPNSMSIDTVIGLRSHSVERILFLAIALIAGITCGLFTGIAFVVAGMLVMLPRLFLPVSSLADAIFETGIVLISGVGLNVWFESHRREVTRREQTVQKLESTSRELQSYVETIKENEKRLSGLHSITTAINELGDLSDILSTAADKVVEVMKVDGILIFLIKKSTGTLKLRQHRGVSEELAHGETRLIIGEGFNGRVVQSGQPMYIEDAENDPRLSRQIVKKEGIVSMFIVPLTARDEVVGTLCVLTHTHRQFTREEEQLLTLIGTELGVAVERATLSEEKQRVGLRYEELFQKAHDAIWMQDMDGTILNSNKAASDYTEQSSRANIGVNVVEFPTPDGLDMAREIRRKLLAGVPVKQPYEQRILRKDGSEAIIMLTTSIVKDESGKPVFQHIARDVTRERKMADNLRLYARQITRAQEEERNRIARELHDDTIQSLIILTRRVDELSASLSKRSKLGVPLEELRKEMEGILARIRLFIQDLRPPTLDYLGLLPAVRELVSQAERQQGIPFKLSVNGEEHRFSPEESLLIYRIIQEALNNIWRHATANDVWITLIFNDDNTTVEIRDNGKGFVIGEDLRFVKSGKIGLASMQERADLLGGKFTIQSQPGQGTTLKLVVPYERWKPHDSIEGPSVIGD